MKLRRRTFRVRVVLSPLIVAAISAACRYVFGVNAATAGFAHLVGILLIAAHWGRTEALVASGAAAFLFNFHFLPPIGRIEIADPENWIALVSFVATSLVASHLSDRARKQTERAIQHQMETDRLYRLSRSVLFGGSAHEIGFRLTQEVAQIFECPAVVLYDPESDRFFYGGSRSLPGIEDRLRRAAAEPPDDSEHSDPLLLIATINRGDCCYGALALYGIAVSPGALQALIKLVALALEGTRAQTAATRAEAARQSEEFKSTLLDALAHEFKTPLASIRIASSTFLSGLHSLPPHLHELARVIDDEAKRLSLLVTDSIRMAQMDASSIELEKRPTDIRDLVARVAAEFAPRLDGRVLSISVDDSLPEAAADPDLASLALRQILDNSLKYSPVGSPVQITAAAAGSEILVRVHDQGPGIPEGEQERIFERFYRRRSSLSGAPGSGLGLYIARRIVSAHGGNVWVEPARDSGASFCMTLPAHAGASR